MKHSLLKMFFFLCFLISPAVCQGESPLGIREFLLSAVKDDSLRTETEALSFLKESPDASFLDEVEFRFAVDEFESDQQEFAVRVRPRGFGEMRDEKRFHSASLQSHEARYERLLQRALKNRYMTVINLLYCQEMMRVYQKLANVHEDRLKVLRKSAEMPGMDPLKLSYDLADAENDLLEVRMEEAELKNRMSLMKNDIRKYMGDGRAIAFDKEKLPDTERISEIIRQIALLPAAENAELRNAERDWQLAKARYDLETSENSAWFSFIEAAYDLKQKDDAEKAFSIEFGFALPIGAENRSEMRERKLQSLKAKTACEILKRQNKESIIRLSEELRQVIRQYEDFRQKKQSGKNRALYDLWEQTEGADPLLLLKLRESMLKREVCGKKLLLRIYTSYTDLLDVSGKLSETPLKNYLSDIPYL